MRIELNDPRPSWLVDYDGDLWLLDSWSGRYAYTSRDSRKHTMLSYASVQYQYGILIEAETEIDE